MAAYKENIEKHEQRYSWNEIEMWQKLPKNIRVSSDSKNRLIYSDPKGSYVFDFQMIRFEAETN